MTSKTLHKLIGTLTLVILTISSQADTVTLKATWKSDTAISLTQKSQKIILAPNQIARILHFYCFTTARGPFSPGPRVSDNVVLNVSYQELTIPYSHSTLFGFNEMVENKTGMAVGTIPTLVGPATLELTTNSTAVASGTGVGGGAVCTIEVVGTAQLQQPTDSQVPPDNGPFQIGLETSTDMENTWQTATLGNYGASDTKRFFRLKILKTD